MDYMNVNFTNRDNDFDDTPHRIIIELQPYNGAKEGERNYLYHIVNAEGIDIIMGTGWNVRGAAKEALDDYEDCFLKED